MKSKDVERRYRTRQSWFFWSQLVGVLAILLVTLRNSGASSPPADRQDLFGAPVVVYLSIVVAIAVVAGLVRTWSSKKWSGIDLRDDAIRKRLHDEHERAIRYRAASRALQAVLWTQALFYGWLTLQTTFVLPLPMLPAGVSQVATFLVAHLVFWIPYLRETK